LGRPIFPFAPLAPIRRGELEGAGGG
jgi:hypothetical protein